MKADIKIEASVESQEIPNSKVKCYTRIYKVAKELRVRF